MSKRSGEFVTLDELIAEIGVDAARWFLLARSHDTTMDLDLDLAKSRVLGEPRLLRAVRPRADRLGPPQVATASRRSGAARRPAELHASERALVQKLLEFGG